MKYPFDQVIAINVVIIVFMAYVYYLASFMNEYAGKPHPLRSLYQSVSIHLPMMDADYDHGDFRIRVIKNLHTMIAYLLIGSLGMFVFNHKSPKA